MTELLPRPFVFLRHGETFYNRAYLIAGSPDVPLTPYGESQAHDASAVLGRQAWSHVAVSTMFRARKTARLALPESKLHVYAGLRERDWGALEKTPIQDPMPYFETPDGGESWADFQRRVLDTLNELLTRFECPLVVAHSGVFRVICNVTQGHPYGARIGNVAPILCQPPAQEDNVWQLTPWQG
ncbi:histidine phosphatase family protein [Kushneria indalinina]|uniref:Putative phosphoglycerate mutase n=1 Tax=Kushneria indalinina DSM 14324 TaxID=1122140 RepID=A0A3D9DYC7_9GAMM|nr:histidine phosphatase family protein [Kushneria indalinina]REC95790.1 putative phosphoglycerate mutase [Kushneria indalinina DSM 14324]